jgi:hypothetical protein
LLGLIKFCLTDGQENKIWLEKTTGLKRDYRVSIVIDTSYSCFNPIMLSHSIQTCFSLIGILAQIEIPFFDLIIATSNSPIILAVNQNSQRALDPFSSDLWLSLLSSIPINETSCNLFDAIQVSMKLKSTSSAKRSYLFVLTDGHFSLIKQNKLKNLFLACCESLIEVYGIGIGCYPSEITSLFSKCIWSVNPNHLISTLSGLFGNEISDSLESIKLFSFSESDSSILVQYFKTITSNWPESSVYKDLYKELRDKTLYSESIDQFQKEVAGIEKLYVNPNITPDTSMYQANAFSGQTILICCFWSVSIAGSTESDWVDPQYLTNKYHSKEIDHPCVADILSYYGITVEVVQTYKNAILKLHTDFYSSTWISCGAGTYELPIKGQSHSSSSICSMC